MTELPDDLSTVPTTQLADLSAEEIADLEARSGAAVRPDDRIAGKIWPRDTVARYWPCEPSSVSRIMSRRGVERVGFDDTTGQATYRAEDVVGARHETPGQGVRTDIRDSSLATTTNPAYLWGRLLAAYEVTNRQWFDVDPTAEPRKTAVDQIREHGGYCPQGLRIRLREDYQRALNRNQDRPLRGARRAAVEALIEVLSPVVDEQLHGRRLTQAEEWRMGIGFLHQRGAFYELSNTPE